MVLTSPSQRARETCGWAGRRARCVSWMETWRYSATVMYSACSPPDGSCCLPDGITDVRASSARTAALQRSSDGTPCSCTSEVPSFRYPRAPRALASHPGANRHDSRTDPHRAGGRHAAARGARQPRLSAGALPGHRHPPRLVHGARLQRARPDAGALGEHGADLRRARCEGRLLPVGRVPDRPAARQQPGQPRHRGERARGDARRSARTSTRCSRSKRNRASATAASGGWRPAIWIRSRRSRCRPSATASVTSSASSIRRSATAGRWR